MSATFGRDGQDPLFATSRRDGRYPLSAAFGRVGHDPRLPVLSQTFDDFLVRAEHDLTCRRHEVKTLRRRARRQRRRETPLSVRAFRATLTAVSISFAVTGSVAILIAVILLITGHTDAALKAFGVSAAAWGAASLRHTVR
ncbi:hypothetical protein ABT272_44000 [Streptomyces sp900105245]|uniref:Uncharacterized protein n=1 Tax=Streptomyces sp. 900105245 TaxID=3154379 RepID=A0ABV1UL89_9ACTN